MNALLLSEIQQLYNSDETSCSAKSFENEEVNKLEMTNKIQTTVLMLDTIKNYVCLEKIMKSQINEIHDAINAVVMRFKMQSPILENGKTKNISTNIKNKDNLIKNTNQDINNDHSNIKKLKEGLEGKSQQTNVLKQCKGLKINGDINGALTKLFNVPRTPPNILTASPSGNLKKVRNTCLPPKRPKVRLKSCQWIPLKYFDISSNDSNIWQRCQKLDVKDIDWVTLESLFHYTHCSKISDALKRHDAKKSTGVDPKKLFAMNIVLKKIKKPPEEIVNLIKEFSIDSLSLDSLKQLELALPSTQDEIKLQKINNPYEFSMPAERFLIMLVKIPSYRVIIRGIVLKEEFSCYFQNIQKIISTIINSIESTLSSASFPLLFKYILLCGNFLNSGNSIGDIFGFSVENFVTTIKITKSRIANLNLLYFILGFFKSEHPEVLMQMEKCLQLIEEATKTDIEDIKQEFNIFTQNYDILNKEIAETEEWIRNHFRTFLHDAGEKLKELTTKMSQLESLLERLSLYFCMNNQTNSPFDILKSLSTLSTEIMQANSIKITPTIPEINKYKTKHNNLG